jgi:hypothetical protein
MDKETAIKIDQDRNRADSKTQRGQPYDRALLLTEHRNEYLEFKVDPGPFGPCQVCRKAPADVLTPGGQRFCAPCGRRTKWGRAAKSLAQA